MRDPFTDPQPGDVIEGPVNGVPLEIHVHRRIGDLVRYGRWGKGESRGVAQITLAAWRQGCAEHHPRIIQLAENAPEWVRGLANPFVRPQEGK